MNTIKYSTSLLVLFALFSCAIAIVIPPNAFSNYQASSSFKPASSSSNVVPPTGYISITDFPANTSEEQIQDATRVKLPGLNTAQSFSAFITVNQTTQANMFFWFFESQKHGANAPVVLWLEGGPGCSSMMETTTIGSLLINPDLSLNATGNPSSWSQDFSVLFIDNPVGVGFSFVNDLTNGYVNNEAEMAAQLYEGLLQFFTRYPSYATNELYIFGISYGGKYVPSIASYIMAQNPSAPLKLNLAGIGLGSGFVDPVNQVTHYADFAYNIGLVDAPQRDSIAQIQKNILKDISVQDWATAWSDWDAVLGAVANYSGGVNPYYVRTYDPNLYDFPHTVAFFQQESIRAALHVGTRQFCPDCANFIPGCDPTVYQHLTNDMLQSVASKMPQLLENLKVFMFSGQFDLIVAVPVASGWIDQVPWSGQQAWLQSTRTPFTLPPTDTNVPTAFVRSSGHLTQALILDAGHIVEYHQPQTLLALITQFIHSG